MKFFEKLKNSFANMSAAPKKVIKYGVPFSVGVCVIGLATYIINQRMSIFNYLGEQFGIHIIVAGMSLLAQFVIGGLLGDIILKRRGA